MLNKSFRTSAPGEQQGTDVVVEIQDEPVSWPGNDEEERKDSGPRVSRIFFGICGLLLVILGIAIVVYVIVIVICMLQHKFTEFHFFNDFHYSISDQHKSFRGV